MRTTIRNTYLMLLVLLQPLAAQVNFTASGVSGANFREVSVLFNATDNQGKQYRSFTPGDFTVVEFGVERPVLRVSCPEPQTPPLSITYLFDISNSMVALNKIGIAKAAGHALAAQFDYPPANAGILGFDDSVYIHQPYTTDKQLILDKINNVTTFGFNTNIYNAFMDPVKGAIAWTKDKPGEKFIVILTDEYRRLTNQEERNIYNAAISAGIKVISVILQPGQQAPSLELISNQTGGKWYRNITDTTQAKTIFEAMGQSIYLWPPCEMVYLADGCETTRTATITLRKGSGSDTETRTYTVPANKIVTLTATPAYVDFSVVPVGQTRTIDVVLKAVNGPIKIDYIQLTASAFSVKSYGGSNPPFTIPAGGTRTLTIEYSSPGSGKVSARQFIVSDSPCPEQIILTGGLVDDNTLYVTYPNGGEKHFVGDLFTYEYSGVPSNKEVAVEYSTNAGATWNLLFSSVFNFRRPWVAANTPSDSCLALIYTYDDRSNPKDSSWLPTHPSTFTSLDVAGMSTILAAGQSDGRVKIYYPYDGALSKIIQAHTGSLNALTFSEDTKWLATAGADRRIKVWNTADGQLAFQSGQFSSATYAVSFSNDGTYLAGSDNGTVSLWRTSDWSQVWSSPNQASANSAVVVDPRLRWVASGNGNSIVLLDIANGTPLASLNGHTAGVRSLDVTEDGLYIVSGSADNTIRLWNTFLETQVQLLTGHAGAVNSVRFGTGGLQVVSTSDDNTVKVWNIKRGTLLYTFGSHTDNVNAADMGRRIGRVFSVGDDNTIRSFTYTPSMADRSDGLWSIIAKITDIVSETPEFDTLLCAGEYSERTIWVKNKGNQDVTLTGISISGSNTGQFSIVSGPTIPPGLVMAPEDSFAVTIRFDALVRGSYSATLDFYTNDPSLPALSILLNGIKMEAALELSEDLIDFGEYYHCSAPDTAIAVVTNTGNVELTVDLTGNPVTGPFTMLTAFPFILAPGGTDTLRIVCLPTTEGTFNALWQIHGLPCNVTHDLNVAATFVNSAPFDVPNPLIFDYTSVGDRSDAFLTIHNRTKLPMNIIDLIVSGPPFSLSNPSIIPLTIAGNDSVDVMFTFAPSVEGQALGTVIIVSNSPCEDTVVVNLQGSSSLKPSIAASIDPFLRLVCPQEMFDDKLVTVRNTGGQPLDISEIKIEGQNPGDFIPQNPPATPLVIPPSGVETFTVRFQPLGIGDRNAELVFTSNAENQSTLRIPLAGRKDSVSFTVSPPQMDFGERYHCTLPVSGVLTLTNTGNIRTSIGLDPASVPVWLNLPPAAFPLVLDAGAQRQVAYTAQTQALGSYQTSLRFIEAECSSEHFTGIAFSYADSKPSQSATLLDFGRLNAGSSDTRTVTLSNAIGSANSVAQVVIGGNNPYISLTAPVLLPASIPQGGQSAFTFTYAPGASDTLDAEVLLITDSPCADTLRVRLRGIGESAGTIVTLPDTTARIGAIIRLPITLVQSENLTLAGATKFAAEITFNASMLWISGVESTFGSVQYNTRVAFPTTKLHLEVTGTAAPQNGVIAELVCLVALGDSDWTPLEFETFEWVGANVAVTAINGSFTAEGICRAGGDRYVGLSGEVEIFQNAPNPFNPRTEIGFMLPEAMHADLRVYSAIGKEIEILVNADLDEGYHSAVFEGNALPSGVYFAVLRAGSGLPKLVRMLMTK